MYLINTGSLALEYFPEHTAVRYAILSHRWEREEVMLQDLRDKTATSKYGYQKLSKTCEQARRDSHQYVWIDTCCIDKTSSAELSEAINSMFTWYRDASICYAYLADVHDVKDLSRSVWFTRGWTLQELIAPTRMQFFDADWTSLGSKESLGVVLARVSGVPTDVLRGQRDFLRLSVAQRMSWQAKREVTRSEDIAYSLLGIMDVNMPLLYGEGMKAFRRLQEEIIRQTDDHTVFAWHLTDDLADGNDTASGLLAPSPQVFAGCSMLTCRDIPLQASTFTTTNRGLSIQLPLLAWSYNFKVALLNCMVARKGSSAKPATVGIFIRPLQESGQYARVTLNGQDRVLFHADCFREDTLVFERDPEAVAVVFHLRTEKGPIQHKPTPRNAPLAHSFAIKTTNMYVRQNPTTLGLLQPQMMQGFWLRKCSPFPKWASLDAQNGFFIRSWNTWDQKTRRLLVPEGCSGAAFIIHVLGRQVELQAFSSGTRADRDSLQETSSSSNVRVPSMLFILGFDKNHKVKGVLKTDPTEFNLACTTDPRSDALVLSGSPWNLDNATAFSKKPFEGCHIRRNDWDVFISARNIDGMETYVVDLLWSGPRSQCDDCGKILAQRQYCCLTCAHYDLCLNCFKMLPKTRHDAQPGREHHLFQTVLLGGTQGEGYTLLNKEQERRLEKPEQPIRG